MKRCLPYFPAVCLVLITLIWWGLAGFHGGWTQTQIATVQVDEITGIEYTEYRSGFVPGVDFLFGGLAVALVFALKAFFLIKIFSNKPKSS
jgi:hypothetical protein